MKYSSFYGNFAWGDLSVNTKIILINIIFFLICTPLLLFGVIPLDWIALKPSNILAGKYLWTFLTSMFMHHPTMIFHIFLNMLSLFFVGSFVQKILGEKRYLFFYLFSGLFSGLFFVLISFFTQTSLEVYAVGASGALFGIIGLMVLLTPNLPVYVMFIPIPIKVKYAAPGMLILLWLVSISGGVPIGNTAHLGGLIAGVIYGIYLRKKYQSKTRMIQRVFC